MTEPYNMCREYPNENIADPAVKFPITRSGESLYTKDALEDFILGETYTVTIGATMPASQYILVYLAQKQSGRFKPVEGLVDTWVATVSITQLGSNPKLVYLQQHPRESLGSCTINWLKIEKGDTRTPNISEYKYRGIGMRDSNNPKDFVWDLAPKYVEENLATESKVTEIIGEANKYTDNSIEAVNINVTNIADDLAKQINVNENAARNYTDTKKIEAVNESKKYTDEVFRKEIVNLTVKNGNLGTARLYRQGNCVTIYFFDLNGRNSGGNDSVILTVPEGYRTPISFEQLVGSTDRSAFNNAQLGFGADGNIYWRRNTSYASSYTFAVTYII